MDVPKFRSWGSPSCSHEVISTIPGRETTHVLLVVDLGSSQLPRSHLHEVALDLDLPLRETKYDVSRSESER